MQHQQLLRLVDLHRRLLHDALQPADGEHQAAHPLGLAGWKAFMELHRGFMDALEICEEVIRERNQARPAPYDVLLPSNLRRGMAL